MGLHSTIKLIICKLILKRFIKQQDINPPSLFLCFLINAMNQLIVLYSNSHFENVGLSVVNLPILI